MAKKIGETKRILVGWGRKEERLCYFLTHREIQETLKDPICCNPKDLKDKMEALVNVVDSKRKLIRTKKRR